MSKLKKKLLILSLIVVAVLVIFKFTPVKELLNLEKIYEKKDQLILSVENNYILSVIVFIISYFLAVAFSIPGAIFLSILAGFFFGPSAGILYINLGATSGAFVIFMAARYFMGESVQKKYQEKLKKFNKEVEENGASYLLFLRLLPVFPFFLINLFSGFTKIPGIVFLWTTALGIIPGSFVYAYIGHAGASIEGGAIGSEIFIAFSLLAIFSLIPVVHKKISGRNNKQNGK